MRVRVRLLALFAGVLLFVLGAPPVIADDAGNETDTYLALGDSVPFGFNPLVSAKDANNFVGYPEIVAGRLDLADVNAACPGEATGGFLSLTGTDNVCRPYRFLLMDPLHVNYSTSQMAFALAFLHAHGQSVKLITLTLGANDAFRFQKDCMAGPTVGTCPLGIAGVFAAMQANLDTILGNIRATGYQGPIVGVTYYALNYADPASVAGSLGLNAQMEAAAAAHGAVIASGFDAWKPVAIARGGGDSCKAGLLIALPIGGCDVHPTPLGRDLLAGAVIKALGQNNDV